MGSQYILVKKTITVPNTATVAAAVSNNGDKKAIFKNCAPFADCISEINNIKVDNAKDIDLEIPMYNLMEYNHNYLKTPGTLC